MAEQPPEEVQRFLDAIEALDAMEDDAACARAATELLKNWPDHHARLRAIRQRRVQALKDQGKTWQEIATILGGIHPTRAQQIAKGLRGEKHRPRPKEKDDQSEE